MAIADVLGETGEKDNKEEAGIAEPVPPPREEPGKAAEGAETEMVEERATGERQAVVEQVLEKKVTPPQPVFTKKKTGPEDRKDVGIKAIVATATPPPAPALVKKKTAEEKKLEAKTSATKEEDFKQKLEKKATPPVLVKKKTGPEKTSDKPAVAETEPQKKESEKLKLEKKKTGPEEAANVEKSQAKADSKNVVAPAMVKKKTGPDNKATAKQSAVEEGQSHGKESKNVGPEIAKKKTLPAEEQSQSQFQPQAERKDSNKAAIVKKKTVPEESKTTGIVKKKASPEEQASKQQKEEKTLKTEQPPYKDETIANKAQEGQNEETKEIESEVAMLALAEEGIGEAQEQDAGDPIEEPVPVAVQEQEEGATDNNDEKVPVGEKGAEAKDEQQQQPLALTKQKTAEEKKPLPPAAAIVQTHKSETGEAAKIPEQKSEPEPHPLPLKKQKTGDQKNAPVVPPVLNIASQKSEEVKEPLPAEIAPGAVTQPHEGVVVKEQKTEVIPPIAQKPVGVSKTTPQDGQKKEAKDGLDKGVAVTAVIAQHVHEEAESGPVPVQKQKTGGKSEQKPVSPPIPSVKTQEEVAKTSVEEQQPIAVKKQKTGEKGEQKPIPSPPIATVTKTQEEVAKTPVVEEQQPIPSPPENKLERTPTPPVVQSQAATEEKKAPVEMTKPLPQETVVVAGSQNEKATAPEDNNKKVSREEVPAATIAETKPEETKKQSAEAEEDNKSQPLPAEVIQPQEATGNLPARSSTFEEQQQQQSSPPPKKQSTLPLVVKAAGDIAKAPAGEEQKDKEAIITGGEVVAAAAIATAGIMAATENPEAQKAAPETTAAINEKPIVESPEATVTGPAPQTELEPESKDVDNEKEIVEAGIVAGIGANVESGGAGKDAKVVEPETKAELGSENVPIPPEEKKSEDLVVANTAAPIAKTGDNNNAENPVAEGGEEQKEFVSESAVAEKSAAKPAETEVKPGIEEKKENPEEKVQQKTGIVQKGEDKKEAKSEEKKVTAGEEDGKGIAPEAVAAAVVATAAIGVVAAGALQNTDENAASANEEENPKSVPLLPQEQDVTVTNQKAVVEGEAEIPVKSPPEVESKAGAEAEGIPETKAEEVGKKEAETANEGTLEPETKNEEVVKEPPSQPEALAAESEAKKSPAEEVAPAAEPETKNEKNAAAAEEANKGSPEENVAKAAAAEPGKEEAKSGEEVKEEEQQYSGGEEASPGKDDAKELENEEHPPVLIADDAEGKEEEKKEEVEAEDAYLAWSMEECDRRLAEIPVNIQALYRKGLIYMSASQLAEAKDMFLKCREIEADFQKQSVVESLADIYGRLDKNWAKAIETYESLLSDNEGRTLSNPGELYMKIGKAYEKTKSFPKAIAAFIKSCELLKEPLFAEFRLGWAYIRNSEKPNGILHLKKALALDGKNVEVLTKLGEAMFKDSETTEEAIGYLKQALVIDPKFPDALVTLGRAYERKQDNDAAIESLEKAKAEAPTNQAIYYYLGRLYFKKADYVKSSNYFKQCLSICPLETHMIHRNRQQSPGGMPISGHSYGKCWEHAESSQILQVIG